MKKNPYLTFPREFTTGKWRVHLVYPGEPRADGFPRGSKNGNPPLRRHDGRVLRYRG